MKIDFVLNINIDDEEYEMNIMKDKIVVLEDGGQFKDQDQEIVDLLYVMFENSIDSNKIKDKLKRSIYEHLIRS